jgi:hypothetical protein
VPYLSWLRALKQVQMNGIVVLELKGDLLKAWASERITEALVDSIRQIAKEIA